MVLSEEPEPLFRLTLCRLSLFFCSDIEEQRLRDEWFPVLIEQECGLVPDPDRATVGSHQPVFDRSRGSLAQASFQATQHVRTVVRVDEAHPQARLVPGCWGITGQSLDLRADVDEVEGWRSVCSPPGLC
jgi:hypothetical protein